ncbi:MAG: glutamate--cysteine ligase [Bradymonadia bacterium]
MSSQTLEDATPLEDISQLAGYFAQGCKPRDQFRVGTEHEKLGWSLADAQPPAYDGPKGIRAFLEQMVARYGWKAVEEHGAIVALSRDGATITLEPGGQLELSGAPFVSLLDTEAELDRHLEESRGVSDELGLIWSGMGYSPEGEPSSVPWMPKPRYAIMRRYLPTRGNLAHHMMALTCTVQANYDFESEADAMRKLRVAMRLQPLVIALWSNSTVQQGKLLDVKTFRARIWEHTDPDRCELSPDVLEPGAGFAEYAAWAAQVPMFFIHREGRYVDCAGLKFSDFMRDGFEGYSANMGDFALHLSTLFPDVRLKKYMEVRGADMGSREYVLALPALHNGLLYDETALSELEALLSPFDEPARIDLRAAAVEHGLAGVSGGYAIKELAAETLAIARRGLTRLEPEAVRLLDVLDASVEKGRSPADDIREGWDGDTVALRQRTRIC